MKTSSPAVLTYILLVKFLLRSRRNLLPRTHVRLGIPTYMPRNRLPVFVIKMQYYLDLYCFCSLESRLYGKLYKWFKLYFIYTNIIEREDLCFAVLNVVINKSYCCFYDMILAFSRHCACYKIIRFMLSLK